MRREYPRLPASFFASARYSLATPARSNVRLCSRSGGKADIPKPTLWVIHVISSAHQPLPLFTQKPTSARAAISDAVANNGLKTAARRSQCSVPDGMQVDHNHQLAGSLFRPRSTKVGRHSGFSASSSRRFGRRRNRVAMAISLSNSRELGTKAEVNTASEGQRTYIGPGDIQSIRPIRIDCWVSIGRPQQAEHALTLQDFLPANVVDVLERDAAGQLD